MIKSKKNSEKTENKGRKKSITNLVLFKEGKSGNPKGRPKGVLNLTTILKKLLEQKVVTTNKKGEVIVDLNGRPIRITRAQWLTMALFEKAVFYKDVPAIKEIMDRIDGKVTDKTELSGPDGGPIKTEDTTDYSKIPIEKRRQILNILKNKK